MRLWYVTGFINGLTVFEPTKGHESKDAARQELREWMDRVLPGNEGKLSGAITLRGKTRSSIWTYA